MPNNQWAVGEYVVDIAITIYIGKPGAHPLRYKYRRTTDTAKGAYRTINTTREKASGLLK
jgi:hypothetical protein